MKNILIISALFTAPTYLLAGGQGGGTPPSRQQLKEQLMSMEFASAALFDNGAGDVGLLTNRELQPELTLSRDELAVSDLKISEADFEKLRDRKAAIDSVGAMGENRSFTVSAGDQIDALKLIDRRAAARAAVAQ